MTSPDCDLTTAIDSCIMQCAILPAHTAWPSASTSYIPASSAIDTCNVSVFSHRHLQCQPLQLWTLAMPASSAMDTCNASLFSQTLAMPASSARHLQCQPLQPDICNASLFLDSFNCSINYSATPILLAGG